MCLGSVSLAINPSPTACVSEPYGVIVSISFVHEFDIHASVFRITEALDDGVHGPHDYLAVATTHVFDQNPDTGGVLTQKQAVLAGEVLAIKQGKATAGSREEALRAAVDALLYELAAFERRGGKAEDDQSIHKDGE